MTNEPPPAGDAPEITPIHLDEQKIDLSDLRWSDSLVLAIFWMLAGVVFLQFFTRYILNDSLGWTEEIARFLLIGVTFTGAVMATRKRTHIAVEFLYRWVPRSGRRIAQFAIDCMTTGFFLLLAVLCTQIAERTQQMMVSLDVPKASIYWYVAACFVAMALYSLWNLVRHLRDGTSPLIDPEQHADQTPIRD